MTTRTDTTDIDAEVAQVDNVTLFDQVTRREMNLTGEEFLRRWDAGDYEGVDFDTVPGLVTVWMYLPFAR